MKACKHQTAVKLVVVDCPPVTEVLIRRPDIKFQLGFSVQNGVVCSLLRGGIAERGGIRVDHRIIEINGESVVAVSHDKIVNTLATAVGEDCFWTPGFYCFLGSTIDSRIFRGAGNLNDGMTQH
ncbi:unnamed protein product [Protopolystoma xenopodis]|uniref:PDZ domain-containing protein n=1 Tax=Protopolystoma xenopodis TaxID=117903 RepID=A0A3S5AG23_9PLAT|nr:unnamed protein product [Protopolystoma xenopodis]